MRSGSWWLMAPPPVDGNPRGRYHRLQVAGVISGGNLLQIGHSMPVCMGEVMQCMGAGEVGLSFFFSGEGVVGAMGHGGSHDRGHYFCRRQKENCVNAGLHK